jgi:hypothetical protein
LFTKLVNIIVISYQHAHIFYNPQFTFVSVIVKFLKKIVYEEEVQLLKDKSLRLQEVVPSAGTTPNEADVTSSNPPPPFLCGHVKKKKKEQKFTIIDCVVEEKCYHYWIIMINQSFSIND